MAGVFTLMRIRLTYLTVVLLWTTTPLAIKWSGEGPGFLFGVTARMTIGMACLLLALLYTQKPLAWYPKALLTYLAVALQIYGCMLPTYWAAQFIPSGWISVIFGLTPLITALLSAMFLGERSLTLGKLTSYSLGIAGLVVMFGSALKLGHSAVLGIGAVLFSAGLQAACSVWIKCIGAKLPARAQVTGGLLIALPAYLVTWSLADGQWPTVWTTTSVAAIIYLGVIATTIGFTFYFYLLTHLSVTRVALISLITPLLALLLGHFINHEMLGIKVVTGTVLILLALILHEFFERLPSINLKSK